MNYNLRFLNCTNCASTVNITQEENIVKQINFLRKEHFLLAIGRDIVYNKNDTL